MSNMLNSYQVKTRMGCLLIKCRASRLVVSALSTLSLLGVSGPISAAEQITPSAVSVPVGISQQWEGSIDDAVLKCQSLKQAVVVVLFQHEEPTVDTAFFTKQVPVDLIKAEKLVPVRVVTPTAGPEAASRWKQVTVLADRYQVKSIPCLVFLDQEGKPVARFDDLPASFSGWSDMVQQARSRMAMRDQYFADASGVEGVDKAASLHRGLQAVGDYWRSHYKSTAEQIIELDLDGSAGLRDQYRPSLVEDQLDEEIQQRVYPMVELGQYVQAREQLDLLLEELPLTTGQSQLVRAFRAQLLYTEGDLVGAMTELNKAVAMGPETAEAQRVIHAREQLEGLTSP